MNRYCFFKTIAMDIVNSYNECRTVYKNIVANLHSPENHP